MLETLPVEQVEPEVLERGGDGDVVLVERGDKPIVKRGIAISRAYIASTKWRRVLLLS